MESSPPPSAPTPVSSPSSEIPQERGSRGVILWTLFLVTATVAGCLWAWKTWRKGEASEQDHQRDLIVRVAIRAERWVRPGLDSSFAERRAAALEQIADEENMNPASLEDLKAAYLARITASGDASPLEKGLVAFLKEDFATASKLQAEGLAQIKEAPQTQQARTRQTYEWMLQGAAQWEQGKKEESEKCFQQAVSVADHGQDPLVWAAALHELAIAQWSGDHYEAAIKTFHKALPALEEATGGKGVEIDTLLYHLGSVLTLMWRQSEATMVLKRSLDLRERRLNSDDLALADVLDVMGQVQHDGGDDEEAEQDWRRTLTIRQKKSNPKDVQPSITKRHLALALAGLSRMKESITLLKEARDTQEQVLHADDSVLCATLAALGRQLAGRVPGNEAETTLRRAMDMAAKAFDPDSLALAEVTDDWISFLLRARRHDEALASLNQVLGIREKVLGAQHPLCGITRVTRGLCLLGLQRMSESEEELRKALAILEKALGENHPVVAAACIKIAVAIEADQRYADAEVFYKRALAILDKRYGRDHDHVPFDLDALLYSGLGVVLQAEGGTPNLDEAETLLRHGITILEKRFSSTDPRLGRLLMVLANVLRAANRDEDAVPLFHRAQPLVREAAGSESMDLARLLTSYGMVLSKLNRNPEAEVQLRGAVSIFDALGSPADPGVPAALQSLGTLLKSNRKYDEAAQVLERARDISEHLYGAKGPFTGRVTVDLAQVLEKQKHYSEARSRYQEALDTLLATGQKDSPATANAQEGLGKCLVWMKDAADAVPLLESALESKTNRLGPRHPEVANLHTWLGHALMDKGDGAAAEQEILTGLKLHAAVNRESAEVCMDERDLGILYSKLSRYPEAQTHLNHALGILKRIGAAEGVDAGQCYTYIGISQMEIGSPEQAIAPLKEALELAQAPGADRDSLKYATLTLGKLYSDLGHYQESDAYLQRGIMLIQERPGGDPDELPNWLNLLAENAEQTKRTAEALHWRRLMLASFERIHGPNDPLVGVALARISNLLTTSKKQSVTGPLLETSLAILAHASSWASQNHAAIQDIATNYQSYLRSTGLNEAQARKKAQEALQAPLPARSAAQLVDEVLGPVQQAQ